MNNLTEIKKKLKKQLSERRYLHSLGVAKAAVELATLYGADVKKAELAGLLHDCAKEMSLKEMREWARKANYQLDSEVFYSRNLLHGPAGAAIAKFVYHIEDNEILEAIFSHTFGNMRMTLLEKIVFVSDFIEPGRQFPGVNNLRKIATTDLNRAVLATFDSTINHLLDDEEFIYILTIQSRNALLREIRG